MHDCGLLGRMFPPFQAITYRVVRDFFHKYTVDEHTLLTIRNLERLVTPSAPDRARFSSLLQDLDAPELLVLSLLLHDVGKWRDDDHHVESVRMAREMFGRIGLPQDARDTVEFLIANHLAMSQVAFRRDTEDPDIVRKFAELVGVEERLKMLCLMTLADVEAVSLETLTPWRAELLWRLYVDTYNHLTLGYGDELIEPDQAGNAELLAHRPLDLSEPDITRFLAGLPRRYLQLFDRDAIYRHVRLARNIRPDEVHLWMEQKGTSWELTVVTLDKPFLFSNISGVLSSFGMDILRGHAMTNPNGLVLDVFQFTDQERFLELNASAREQMFTVLNDVVSGRVTVTERLRGRAQSLFNKRAPRVTPVVHCDSTSSKRYTIIDIIADDELGLLYRISRVMSQNGCDVDLVLIATEGHRAIDVFHITKAGRKLSEPDQVELAAHLQRMLEGGYEAN
jgi:[protein-PII] uridylyltransferase